VSLTGPIAKVYDGSNFATLLAGNYLVSGVDGDTIVMNNPTTGTYNTKNAATGKAVSVSGLVVTSASNGAATVYGYQTSGSATGTGIITPAVLTVSAAGVNRAYNASTVASVLLSDDRFAGDLLTTNYGSANFLDKNIGTAKQVDVSGISLSGADAGNYTFNTTALTFADISPAALTVIGIPKTKVLGTSDPLLTYMVNGLYEPVNNVLTGELARDAGETIGTYRVNVGTLALLTPNYTLNYVPCNFTILAPTVVQEITQASLKFGTPKTETAATTEEEDEKLAEEAIATEVATAEGIISGAEVRLPVCR
jgi:hypothetical protein